MQAPHTHTHFQLCYLVRGTQNSLWNVYAKCFTHIYFVLSDRKNKSIFVRQSFFSLTFFIILIRAQRFLCSCILQTPLPPSHPHTVEYGAARDKLRVFADFVSSIAFYIYAMHTQRTALRLLDRKFDNCNKESGGGRMEIVYSCFI